MIIITGGSGFIGSNLTLSLNQQGIDDILIVDDLHEGKKFSNIATAQIQDYVDLAQFREQINNQYSFPKIDAVFILVRVQTPLSGMENTCWITTTSTAKSC